MSSFDILTRLLFNMDPVYGLRLHSGFDSQIVSNTRLWGQMRNIGAYRVIFSHIDRFKPTGADCLKITANARPRSNGSFCSPFPWRIFCKRSNWVRLFIDINTARAVGIGEQDCQSSVCVAGGNGQHRHGGLVREKESPSDFSKDSSHNAGRGPWSNHWKFYSRRSFQLLSRLGEIHCLWSNSSVDSATSGWNPQNNLERNNCWNPTWIWNRSDLFADYNFRSPHSAVLEQPGDEEGGI